MKKTRETVKNDIAEKAIKLKEYKEKLDKFTKLPDEIRGRLEDWKIILEGEKIKLEMLKIQMTNPKVVNPHFEIETSKEWQDVRMRELVNKSEVQLKQVDNYSKMMDDQMKQLNEQQERLAKELPTLKGRLKELGCDADKELEKVEVTPSRLNRANYIG
jgi:chromosome segregation ATPase